MLFSTIIQNKYAIFYYDPIKNGEGFFPLLLSSIVELWYNVSKNWPKGGDIDVLQNIQSCSVWNTFGCGRCGGRHRHRSSQL